MADTAKGDVPKVAPATHPPDHAPTTDTSKTTPPKDVEMKDADKVASADDPPPAASTSSKTNPDADKISGETDTKANGSVEPTGGTTPANVPTNADEDTIASAKDADMKDALMKKPTETPTSASTNISKSGSAPALPLGDVKVKDAGSIKPTDDKISSTPEATALDSGKAPVTDSSKPIDGKDAGPKSTAIAEIVPPKDDGKPFTKLHMIQADYGDTLLLEYRAKDNDPPKFWLTDGGPSGTRFGDKEYTAAEQFFIAMNSVVPTGAKDDQPGVPAPLERMIVTHPHEDHVVGIDNLLRSILFKVDASKTAGTSLTDLGVRRYSWQNGVKFITAASTLPFSKIWFNDSKVFLANIGELQSKAKKPPSDEKKNASWIVDRLAACRASYTTLPDSAEILNTEFRETPSGEGSSSKPPEYGMVCTERAAKLTTLANANIVGPTLDDLKKYWGKQEQGFTRLDFYKNFRSPPAGKSSVEPRNIEKWLSKSGATDLPVSGIKPDTSLPNCISIVYEFNNADTSSLMTGDNVGTLFQQQIQNLRAAADIAKPKTYDVIKMPHHGGCYNCLASWPPPKQLAVGKSSTSSPMATMLSWNINYFKYFKAKNYCFSSNPFGDHANPDIYTASAIVDGYKEWPEDKVPTDFATTNIVMTNGMSYNGYKLFLERTKLCSGKITFNVYITNRNESYCTIDTKKGPSMDQFSKIESNEQFYKYYKTEMDAHAAALGQTLPAPSEPEKTSLPPPATGATTEAPPTEGAKVPASEGADEASKTDAPKSPALETPTKAPLTDGTKAPTLEAGPEVSKSGDNEITDTTMADALKPPASEETHPPSKSEGAKAPASKEAGDATMTDASKTPAAGDVTEATTSKAPAPAVTDLSSKMENMKLDTPEKGTSKPSETEVTLTSGSEAPPKDMKDAPLDPPAEESGKEGTPSDPMDTGDSTKTDKGASEAAPPNAPAPTAEGGAVAPSPPVTAPKDETIAPPKTEDGKGGPEATPSPPKSTPLEQKLNDIFAQRTYEDLSKEDKGVIDSIRKGKAATKRKETDATEGAEEESGDGEKAAKKKRPATTENSPKAKGAKRKSTPKETDKKTISGKPRAGKPSKPTDTGTPGPSKKRKMAGAEGAVSHLAKGAEASTNAFGMPCLIRRDANQATSAKEIPLDWNAVQADQGSDFNLITSVLAIQLGLSTKSLSQLGFRNDALIMKTSEGRKRTLTKFVSFDLGVSGIWRTIQCFVLPAKKSSTWSADEVQLLLGMPWLHAVNAIINIRDSSVDIGDPSRGEAIQRIRGPRQGFKTEHSLLMYPLDDHSRHVPLCRQSFSAQSIPNGLPNEGPDSDNEDDDDDDDGPSLQEVWHDFNISQFKMAELPNWAYFQDYEPPETNPDFSPTSSPGEQAYVNLTQFVDLLKWDNGLQPVDSRPKLDNAYFNLLENWLPVPGQYENGADALLGILLSALLDSNAAAQILSALPLNPNGPTDYLDAIEPMTIGAAITKLPVHNLRFEVRSPSPETGPRLEVLSIFFELQTSSAPSAFVGNSLPPGDIMTWRVPFANDNFSSGQFTFNHDPKKGIRVKIVWPFYQNRMIIGHFNSTLNIYKSRAGVTQNSINLPCTGAFYRKSNQNASYDIKLGDMDLLQLFSCLHPIPKDFSTTFGNELNKINIEPLTKIANGVTELQVKDVGIVFRQQVPHMNAVILHHVHGTLDFSDSPSKINLPGLDWKLPLDDLPALTLNLGKTANQTGHTVGVALTKTIPQLGFVALQASFSKAKQRTQFDATIMFDQVESLGGLVEQGFGLLGANCLDDQFQKSIHLGSLSPKSVVDGLKDALDDITIPYARVQVAKLDNGSFGVTEFELKLDVADLAFPADKPAVQLKNFAIIVLQERSGSVTPGSESAAGATVSSSLITVFGSATVMLGSIDAECSFNYDPTTDAQLADIRFETGLNVASTNNPNGRQLTFQVMFPGVKPALGDLVNQVVGEVGTLTHGGTFHGKMPSALTGVLDIAELLEIELTICSAAQENAPWTLSTVFAEVDLSELFDDIEALFDDAFKFEQPMLSIRVNNPTTAATRGFEIGLSSQLDVNGVVCKLIADISKDSPANGLAVGDTVSFSFEWDPVSQPLSLGDIIEWLGDLIVDATFGNKAGSTYLDDLRALLPSSIVALVDDIDIETVQIIAANFSSDPSKTKFSLATIYIVIQDNRGPWLPLGDLWPHLSFYDTSLGYSYYSGQALADPGSTAPLPKGYTTVNFATQMTAGSLDFGITFNYTRSATETSLMISLIDTGDQPFSIIDLVSAFVNDLHGDGISAMTFPSDAKKLFDIDIASFNLTYTNTVAPAAPAETISVQQTGDATFLGITVASISIVCNKAQGTWGYGLNFTLLPVEKPFAKILKIAGIDDFAVSNGAFGMFKGPAVAPPLVAPMVGPTGSNTSMFLSGGLSLNGNDFLHLVGTIVKIPEVEFAVQSGGSLTITIPVGKLELTVAGQPMFSVENFLLTVAQGNFTLSAEIDFLADWLAPSIKTNPIGFQFSLGIAADSSLLISIYAVDPKTHIVYPDMSTDTFIVRPFYIPGLVLYPFHFSMRWLAEAEEPEALAAGGGFAIQGMNISNVFAFSMDERNPTKNYIELDIENMTLGTIIGSLIPDNKDVKAVFDIVDIGFKSLKINLSPAQRKFMLYADVYFLCLEGKAVANADPLSGIAASATMKPIDFGNGLLQLCSLKDSTKGPFFHINTDVKDIVSGKVPQNPQTPDWAGVTSDDPKLDNSMFALTAKLVFLGSDLEVFGLLDTSGLTLFISQGVNVNLPGMKFSASRTLSMTVNKKMFSVSAGLVFDLDIDIPPIHIGGNSFGGSTEHITDLDVGLTLQINYDTSGWLNDGLLFELDFHLDILGLTINVDHLEVDVTVKELKHIPDLVANWVRDHVVDMLKSKLEQGWKDVEHAGKEAAHVLTKGWNATEHGVVHLFDEGHVGMDHLADTMKNTLGLGLDDSVKLFNNLGHDISHFGDSLAKKFHVSSLKVAHSAINQGLCTAEHAMVAGLGKPVAAMAQIGHGAQGVANKLSNVGHAAIGDMEKKGAPVLNTIGSGAKTVGHDIGSAGKDAGKAVEKKGKEAGASIEETGKKVASTGSEAGKDIKSGAKTVGSDIEKGGKKALHTLAHVFHL